MGRLLQLKPLLMMLKILFIGNSRPVFERLLKNSFASVECFVTENHDLSKLGNHVLGPKFEMGYEELVSNVSKQSKRLRIDLGICASFGILPESVLEYPDLGFVNLHPAELPRFAGRFPFPQLIESEVAYSYSTLHLMTKKIDEGKILCQSRYLVGVNDYYEDWLSSSDYASCELITRFLNSSPREVFKNLSKIQDPIPVTYSRNSSLPYRDLSISPSLSLYNAIRINSLVGGTRLFRENGCSILVFKSQLIYPEDGIAEVYEVLDADDSGFDLGLGQQRILRVTHWTGEKLNKNEKVFRLNQSQL